MSNHNENRVFSESNRIAIIFSLFYEDRVLEERVELVLQHFIHFQLAISLPQLALMSIVLMQSEHWKQAINFRQGYANGFFGFILFCYIKGMKPIWLRMKIFPHLQLSNLSSFCAKYTVATVNDHKFILIYNANKCMLSKEVPRNLSRAKITVIS